MHHTVKLAILQSARIAELKMAAGLVKPRPRVELPRDPTRKSACLLALLVAERRRNAELVASIRDNG